MEHICENCKYFSRHFVKHGSSLTAVSCGSCRNPKLTMAQKRKRQRAGVCEHREWNEPEKEEQSLEKVLLDIAQQLSAIASILKKDRL